MSVILVVAEAIIERGRRWPLATSLEPSQEYNSGIQVPLCSRDHNQSPDSAGKAKISSVSWNLGASNPIYPKPGYFLSRIQRFHHAVTDLSGPQDCCKRTWKGNGGPPRILATGCECSYGEAKVCTFLKLLPLLPQTLIFLFTGLSFSFYPFHFEVT